MSLVVVPNQGTDDAALREGAEWCVRRYAEPAELIRPGEEIPVGKHVNLPLDSPGRKSFFLEVDTQVRVGLYAQHTAEEFDLQLTNAARSRNPASGRAHLGRTARARRRSGLDRNREGRGRRSGQAQRVAGRTAQ